MFTEKWEEILEKVEKGCDGKSYLENVEKKLEELRNAFDDRSGFDDMEAKYKEQIAALHENLESERENTANTAGDNSEMKCKMDMLEERLEALKRENEEAKEKLADDRQRLEEKLNTMTKQASIAQGLSEWTISFNQIIALCVMPWFNSIKAV